MALIKIDSVSVTEAEDAALKQQYLYKDLFLDIKNRVSFNRQLNRKEELKDVQGLFDIESIQNSIANALLTSPGEKILNPEFGIDLRRFIFDPVSPFTELEIQSDIEENLPKYILDKYKLMDRRKSIICVHKPRSYSELSLAINRLKFEEIFYNDYRTIYIIFP